MAHLSLKTHKMYYEIEGKGDPLVLIAGYSCDIGIWTSIRKELAKSFQLILFDNRGVGRSSVPKEDFTLDDMAEDTLALIKSLQLKKPHILGHSMGGAIAQIIARKHPEKVGKTVFAQTTIHLSPPSKIALRAQLHLLQNNIPIRLVAETIFPWLFSDAFLANEQFCEEYLRLREEYPYKPTAEGLTKLFRALMQFDSSSWYGEIKTAPLILIGEEDRLCPPKEAEQMAKMIPHAKTYLFRNTGHAAFIERPLEFCQVIGDYFGK